MIAVRFQRFGRSQFAIGRRTNWPGVDHPHGSAAMALSLVSGWMTGPARCELILTLERAGPGRFTGAGDGCDDLLQVAPAPRQQQLIVKSIVAGEDMLADRTVVKVTMRLPTMTDL
ncbi:MAG: hypothetical protein OXK19_01525 [Candidatus Dadabacteria bacterium]|nr:hypothetical protein [Candidatus Dadabacteria bacterium]